MLDVAGGALGHVGFYLLLMVNRAVVAGQAGGVRGLFGKFAGVILMIWAVLMFI